MAVIGYLGESAQKGIIFEVSPETFETINNMVWSGSARYATHQRHMNNALTEFVGRDPDKMIFDITLLAELSVDPLTEMVKIWNYQREGTALQFVLGEKIYGKYRWNITDNKFKAKHFDVRGNLYCVDASISMVEYLDG